MTDMIVPGKNEVQKSIDYTYILKLLDYFPWKRVVYFGCNFNNNQLKTALAVFSRSTGGRCFRWLLES